MCHLFPSLSYACTARRATTCKCTRPAYIYACCPSAGRDPRYQLAQSRPTQMSCPPWTMTPAWLSPERVCWILSFFGVHWSSEVAVSFKMSLMRNSSVHCISIPSRENRQGPSATLVYLLARFVIFLCFLRAPWPQVESDVCAAGYSSELWLTVLFP